MSTIVDIADEEAIYRALPQVLEAVSRHQARRHQLPECVLHLARQAMGRAGRKRVDQIFDIRHHVQKMEALFDAVLTNTATSAPGVTARATLERP